MKTWIWPFSWRCRITELEAEVSRLKADNKKLDAALRAAGIQQASMASYYVTAMNSLSSMIRNH